MKEVLAAKLGFVRGVDVGDKCAYVCERLTVDVSVHTMGRVDFISDCYVFLVLRLFLPL